MHYSVHTALCLHNITCLLDCTQERLQKDLQSERKKRADAEILHKRAESNLRHLQLQNPSLSLEAMQHLLDAQDQVGH
jgi:hypothetical protein